MAAKKRIFECLKCQVRTVKWDMLGEPINDICLNCIREQERFEKCNMITTQRKVFLRDSVGENYFSIPPIKVTREQHKILMELFANNLAEVNKFREAMLKFASEYLLSK